MFLTRTLITETGAVAGHLKYLTFRSFPSLESSSPSLGLEDWHSPSLEEEEDEEELMPLLLMAFSSEEDLSLLVFVVTVGLLDSVFLKRKKKDAIKKKE